ncbi:hypothetical protein KKH24_03350, partial [Patescibacteria group bacterium]|nr:hypothetical protein [Patescibacteria group bacterium]
MRNSALSAFLFAMALVAVAVINPNQANAGLMPEFLMSEEACLARGEPPEFCAHLAVPTAETEADTEVETVTETETDADTQAEEPTVWIPRSAIPVWREVPLSQIPAPEP